MKIKQIVLVSSRDVLVIGSTNVSTTDILIFTVMIIGTDSQKKLIQLPICARKINLHAKECFAAKWC